MSPAVAGKICAAETRRGGGCARAKDGDLFARGRAGSTGTTLQSEQKLAEIFAPCAFLLEFSCPLQCSFISGNWLVSSTPMATRKAIGFLSSVVQNTNRAPPCNCALDFDGSFLDP
jgi:hypothetical protein